MQQPKVFLSIVLLAILVATSAPGAGAEPEVKNEGTGNQSYRTAQSVACGTTCGRARTCRDAVYLWCVCGYRRADRDSVPCERVCGQSTKRNLEKVMAIMRDLGCR